MNGMNLKLLFSGTIGKLLFFVAIALGVYFVNVEVQSYFGRQAVERTGLVSTSFNDALVRAKSEDKLVLVDVSAIWCSTCRTLDNEVFSKPEVRRAINDRYIFSRIEYESDEGQQFLERYSASGFPTLWLINGEGIIVKRLNVTFDPQNFIAQLERVGS
ncbi:MAG: thioredoxin family protein [Pyrinomonadaceae bacterium]